ncbi:MAG: DUF2948 family protein [Parvularculaceae bacterium]|nr:DUF2948 family protein [Parvularculaceae bacterium]
MANLRDYRPLRLMTEDAEDLKVLSAMLQDAIGKVGDFAYLPEQRRFAFVANRFVWEIAGERRRGAFARVRAGCHFDDVIAVRQQNLRTDTKNGVVELLAISFEPGENFKPGEDGAGIVTLEFAGGGAIRFDVESVNAQLSDISAPWPVRMRPDHGKD